MIQHLDDAMAAPLVARIESVCKVAVSATHTGIVEGVGDVTVGRAG